TPQEAPSPTACSADSEFAQWPWTAAVINTAIPTPCGIVGKFTTPRDLRTQDCYNVTVDCENRSAMKITASHCSTDVIFDSRQYQCIASWNEDKSIYMFAVRSQETHSCFVAEYSSGRLYLASTGTHCIRNFSFSEHSDKTIVLEEEGLSDCFSFLKFEKAGCATPQKLKPSRKPAGPVTKSSPTALVDASSENASSHSLPVSKSSIDGLQWAT
ncbi:hypothetical protein GCK32_016463, partial [Trichostrongylus colubriformis]